MIGEVRVPPGGGLSLTGFCDFDSLEGSLKLFFSRETFSTRSVDLNERLNMVAVGVEMLVGMGDLLNE